MLKGESKPMDELRQRAEAELNGRIQTMPRRCRPTTSESSFTSCGSTRSNWRCRTKGSAGPERDALRDATDINGRKAQLVLPTPRLMAQRWRRSFVRFARISIIKM